MDGWIDGWIDGWMNRWRKVRVGHGWRHRSIRGWVVEGGTESGRQGERRMDVVIECVRVME